MSHNKVHPPPFSYYSPPVKFIMTKENVNSVISYYPTPFIIMWSVKYLSDGRKFYVSISKNILISVVLGGKYVVLSEEEEIKTPAKRGLNSKI